MTLPGAFRDPEALVRSATLDELLAVLTGPGDPVMNLVAAFEPEDWDWEDDLDAVGCPRCLIDDPPPVTMEATSWRCRRRKCGAAGTLDEARAEVLANPEAVKALAWWMAR